MRTPILLITLAILFLFVGACENDSRRVTRPGDVTSPMILNLDDSEDCEWSKPSPSVLATLEWEEFTGSIQPGEGGIVTGKSTTWGPDCSFAIEVPPGALPMSPDGAPVEFSIRIPTRDSYLRPEHMALNCENGLPLIMELEPSGVNFLEPVTVHATYMPWTDVTSRDVAESAWWFNEPVGPYELRWAREKEGVVSLAFRVWHFSRWGVGSPDPPIPPPGG